MRQTKLTKNPTLLTIVLSAATVAGYVTYRLTLDTAADPAGQASHENHAGQPRLLDSLPEIVLEDLAGEPVALGDFAGKALLVNYWATWCAPCLREIPLLKTFHEAHPNIEVIGIAADYADAVREFAPDMDFNYPALVGANGPNDAMSAAAALGVEVVALPFSVFISADGAVLGVQTGEIHQEHLDNLAATMNALASGEIDREIARERLAALH